MDPVLLLIVFLFFSVLSVMLVIDRKIFHGDVFSPGSIFVYFSFLSGFTLFWFSLSNASIERLVFDVVDGIYRDMGLVREAYLYTLLGIVATYIGIFVGGAVKHPYFNHVLDGIVGAGILEKNTKDVCRRGCFRTGMMIFLSGVFVYVYFIYQMGGLTDLWLNLNERVGRSAGLGYLQGFYTFSVFLGSLLIVYSCFRRRSFLVATLVILGAIFILASLGQRGPVAEYIFALIILYHYKVKTIRRILTFKKIFLCLLLLMFMVVSVQFRVPGSIEKYAAAPGELLVDVSNTFERHVIARFGRVERDIVVLKYFKDNELWYGASYSSLITAPLPRNIYEEKPPVDTGRYLLAMSKGEIIYPPIPVSDLPSSSWPDGNWAGYMNFHFPGFILAFFLSGLILGMVYQYMCYKRMTVGAVAFYAIFSWGGAPSVSPMGVVSIAISVAMLVFWCSVFRMVPPFMRKIGTLNNKGLEDANRLIK